MSARLEGLSALVTGRGDGIGLSAAQLFAQEGAHVLVADIVPERAQSALETIKAAGGLATPLVGDVSDEASVRAMVEASPPPRAGLMCFSTMLAAALAVIGQWLIWT